MNVYIEVWHEHPHQLFNIDGANEHSQPSESTATSRIIQGNFPSAIPPVHLLRPLPNICLCCPHQFFFPQPSSDGARPYRGPGVPMGVRERNDEEEWRWKINQTNEYLGTEGRNIGRGGDRNRPRSILRGSQTLDHCHRHPPALST